MAARPRTPDNRPAAWARALLAGSIAFAGVSVVLLGWF